MHPLMNLSWSLCLSRDGSASENGCGHGGVTGGEYGDETVGEGGAEDGG